jgi:hypothetical protein
MKRRHPARRPQSRRQPNVLAASQPAATSSLDALIKVVRHRFSVFRKTFGRDPKPHEPLFFVEGEPRPILAAADTIKDQLAEAAAATGVELQQLLKFLRVG